MNLKSACFVLLCTVAAAGPAAMSGQVSSPDSKIVGDGNDAPVKRAGGVTSPDSKIVGDGKGKMAGKSTDKMFLMKAAEGGYTEVQMGQLATQKAASDDVKQFGQKMIDDHTSLNDQLKPFADAKGIAAPTKLGAKEQAEYDKLNGLSGADFDKEYISYMVKDHHEDLKEFKKEASTTKDPSLRDTVSKGETVIQQHTEMAEKIAKDRGISVMHPMSSGTN